MGDIDYGAVFGIDMAAAETGGAEGENGQGVAAPAQDTGGAQGEKEQDHAAPAVEVETPGAGEGAETGTGEGAQPPEGEPAGAENAEQPPDERSRYAAARRKAEAERDAAVAQAKQDAQRAIDDYFRNSGLTNPYTGQPITSKAEFDAYQQRYQAEQKNGFLQKTGMSEEEFDQFVAALPEVQQARLAQQAAEAAAREAREQQAKAKVEEQLREISQLDPSIKTLQDLSKMETYPAFYEQVQKGYTLTDAFKLANFEKLRSGAAEASRQAAINAAQSKQHLEQTTQRGAGAVSVPAEVKEEYRAFNPDATDAEIQQHYAKYVKR